jgi:hypothetical protein
MYSTQRNKREPVIIQLAIIFTLYEGQHYSVVVDLNDPYRRWSQRLFRGHVYRNFLPVIILYKGSYFYALGPLPPEAMDPLDVADLRGRGPTIDTVLVTMITTHNREYWRELETSYSVRVHSGYGV